MSLIASRVSAVSVLALCSLVLPILADAQTLQNTLALISSFLNSIVYLLITGAIIVFFWGLIRYLMGNSGEEKAKGMSTMLMGVITIFVMVSIWGIIRLLQNTFRVTSTEPVVPKTIQLGGFQ